MVSLSLSTSAVQTNYKGRSPIRKVGPLRNTLLPENICVTTCIIVDSDERVTA
jgi:hypothetical protein